MSDAHHDEIAKLEALYAQNPEGRLFTHLAEACRKVGDLDRAREVLTEGIQRHPDYSSAHVVLGRVLMDLDQYDEARAEFRRVLELDGHNLVALRSLGDIARIEGRDEDALEHYHQLLDLEPSDSDVRSVVDEMTDGLVVPAPGDEPDEAPEPEADERADGPETDEWADEVGEPETDAWTGDAEPEAVEPEAVEPMGMDEESGGEGEGADVMTETIAQVYARQGLYDRAAEVYRELVRTRPDDEGLRERLAEMEEKVAEAAAAEEVSGIEMEDTGELAPDEAGPVEGFQTVEFEADAEEEGVAPLAGFEPDQPEARPDADDQAEPEGDDWDLGGDEEWDVADPDDWAADGEDEELDAPTADPVPEATEFAEAADFDEVDEVDEVETDEDEPASPWTDEDRGPEAAAETPYAWADAGESEEDASPPIRDYMQGLLGWGGARETTSPPAPSPAAEAEEAKDAAEPEEAEEAPDGDEDLDVFRSWLESLKQ